jgi:hypothetical protein
MFTESNVKLQQTRDLLVELIAELDLVLEEVRTLRRDTPVNGGVDGESDYLRRIVLQREQLVNVAMQIADMQFEWRNEPQHQGEG